jgi:hypothetical protein
MTAITGDAIHQIEAKLAGFVRGLENCEFLDRGRLRAAA